MLFQLLRLAHHAQNRFFGRQCFDLAQRYPTAEQGLNALVVKPETSPVPGNWKPGGYLERLPKDPWGNPYQYVNPGLHGEIDVLSTGADGKPGGEGLDADIGSWQ